MPRVGRPSQRNDLIERAATLARSGERVSFDSLAKVAGITKPGLMYHFPTKRDLMSAVVDHVIGGYQDQLRSHLQSRGDSDWNAVDRIAAYLDWICTSDFAPGDLTMFADPALREPLLDGWNAQIAPWVELPSDLSPSKRTRLTAARLAADGIWFESMMSGSKAVPRHHEVQKFIKEMMEEIT